MGDLPTTLGFPRLPYWLTCRCSGPFVWSRQTVRHPKSFHRLVGSTSMGEGLREPPRLPDLLPLPKRLRQRPVCETPVRPTEPVGPPTARSEERRVGRGWRVRSAADE